MSRDMKVKAATDGTLNISAVCTVTHTLYEIKVDNDSWERWQKGTPVQVAFPELSPSDREFLKSGLTPAEWNAMLGVEGE